MELCTYVHGLELSILFSLPESFGCSREQRGSDNQGSPLYYNEVCIVFSITVIIKYAEAI